MLLLWFWWLQESLCLMNVVIDSTRWGKKVISPWLTSTKPVTHAHSLCDPTTISLLCNLIEWPFMFPEMTVWLVMEGNSQVRKERKELNPGFKNEQKRFCLLFLSDGILRSSPGRENESPPKKYSHAYLFPPLITT